MIDLINENTDELLQNYSNILELIPNKKNHSNLAIIFDNGIKYIKKHYGDLDIDWKTWSLLYLKYKYFNNEIKKESDIYKLINDFINYYKENYNNYINDIVVFSDDFDKNLEFLYKYMRK